MNKQRLLELAGIEITEAPKELKDEATKLKIQANKFHGDIIQYKQKSHERVHKLEDVLYKVVKELDDFIEGKELVKEGAYDSKINYDALSEIKYLLSQSTMTRGEERTLSAEEIKKFNTLLREIITNARTLHTIAYDAAERYKKKG